MKNLLIGLMALTATLATAEPEKNGPAASTTATVTKTHSDSATASSAKTNQIRRGRVAYSGAVVTAIKVKNPLQMINPFAPMAYGSGEDNVCRDPNTGRARGIKVLSMTRER